MTFRTVAPANSGDRARNENINVCVRPKLKEALRRHIDRHQSLSGYLALVLEEHAREMGWLDEPPKPVGRAITR